MKDEPAIVKELKQAEKLGLLKFDSQGNINIRDSNIIGTIDINHDVTEIKKSEEKYKHLFDNTMDPIVIIDKKGKFVDVNEQVIKLLEYDKKELIGKDFIKINFLTKASIKKAQDNFIKRMK